MKTNSYLCDHNQYIKKMIALIIKEIAQEKGMTLKDICEKCGYKSLPSFYRQINNPENINMKTLLRIANTLGCEVGELFASNRRTEKSTFVCPHCGKELHIKIE